MKIPTSVYSCNFHISLAVHYHMRRQQFFEFCHRSAGVLSLIFSTSAVAAFVGKSEYAAYLAALIAIVQCIDLIVDTRGKATLHDGIRRDYLALNQLLMSYGKTPSEEQFIEFANKVTQIEMVEPPIKKVLLELSRNDAARSMGCDEKEIINVFWLKSMTANLFNWPSSIPNQ